MFKYLTSIILISLAVGVFVMFTNPFYNDISLLQAKVSAYDEALNNSKDLENERDKLTAKYNTVSADNLAKIKKLLPDSVDNIRLILEIEKLALPYGMALRDVQYSVVKEEPGAGSISNSSARGASTGAGYGAWELEFSVTGAYNNLINFTRSLESNLRIVDISSLQFTSTTSTTPNTGLETYRFAYKVKTYWLNN